MSLATRCTHCGTIFKVVQDQLKVSEGWVRCGRCNEVFNALPALFDLDTEAPPPRQAPTPPPAPPASPSTPPSAAPVPAAAQARPTAPASPPTPSAPTARPVPPTRPAAPPPTAPATPATPTRADVLADAPLNLGQPRKPLSDFELDTSVPLRDVPAAVPPGGAVVDDFDAGTDSVPMTYEADALESRYLLPSTSRSRKPAARRTTGPEFADAEFPTDAWLDAEDNWSLDLPPLPSTAPPSLARQSSGAAPADSIAARAPGTSTAPNSTELAAQALAALSALPAADTEPENPGATPPALTPKSTTTVAVPLSDGSARHHNSSPVDEPLDVATVPSRFAGDDDTSMPPTPVTEAGSAVAGQPLTEAELLASRQKRPGRKGRPAQAPTPQFIRQAERQALWRNPGIRGVLTGLSLALGLTLAAQVAHHQRDWLAAHHPVLKPWLSQWCTLVGCELKLLRQLDQLQVDHAAFVRAESEGPDRYRLSLVVRNLAKTDLAWPAVDLVLNDANGQVMARRTLKVGHADWLAETPVRASTGVRPPEAINAAATGTLSWSLQLEDLTPAGYTAELFYLPDQP